MAFFLFSVLLNTAGLALPSSSGFLDTATDTTLVFPGILHQEQLIAGNPLATYSAMIELEERYLNSPVFSKIYPEVKANFEQFLGVPGSGMRAMSLPAFRRTKFEEDVSVLESYTPRIAMDEIIERAGSTQIVVWGEEHHLPQTRSLYESLLESLWEMGYRYLAAETFSSSFASDPARRPDYESGYYLRDPVFAHAVRTAQDLGYHLIAYDTNERGEDSDQSFRDRTQAQNIYDQVFADDPEAKVLVLAGRGHASEQKASDGWTPMAFVLKQLTGIDPLTIYAPTMSERLTSDEEHPIFRHASSLGLIESPTIFVDEETHGMLGTTSFDAYIFWPRTSLREGRPDWLTTIPRRSTVKIPHNLSTDGLSLVQAFYLEDSYSMIPVDQVLIDDITRIPSLVLPIGDFRVRSIDRDGTEVGSTQLTVR